jgi:NAD(P)-dependent dehydrogenase (short-subunit alcohol dehydrogenase family)
MMFDEPDLSEKTALITGGSAGIGRAVALAFAARGAEVWITGRRPEPLQETAAMAEGKIHWRALDVTDVSANLALAQSISASSGSLDILVNNAAILGPMGPLEDTDLSEVRAVWDVNIHGSYVTTQVMLPLMQRAVLGACVINLSSGVGRQGRAGWGPYAASKFAIEGLTQCWADELKNQGISVFALNPGATATTMRATAKPQEDPRTLPQPADLLPAFLYLLSEDAREKEVPGASIDARDFLN